MTGAPIVPCPERIKSRVYMSMVVSPVHFALSVSSTEHRSQAPSHVQSCEVNKTCCRNVPWSITVCRRCLVSPGVSFLTDVQETHLSGLMCSLLSQPDQWLYIRNKIRNSFYRLLAVQRGWCVAASWQTWICQFVSKRHIRQIDIWKHEINTVLFYLPYCDLRALWQAIFSRNGHSTNTCWRQSSNSLSWP